MRKRNSTKRRSDPWEKDSTFPDKKGRSPAVTPSVTWLDPQKIQHHTKIKPRTPNQRTYMEALMDRGLDVVAAIGEPRSGKTLLPVYGAVEMINSGDYPHDQILYLHPDTLDEDGVGMGFLQGNYEAKIREYAYPFMDSLDQFMDKRQVTAFLESKKVGFMLPARLRGRSFDDRYIVIADEMQNWTERKIRLLVTRLNGAKLIMTGAPDQVDSSTPESFTLLLRLVSSEPVVKIVHLGLEDIQSDVVRRFVECLGDFGVGVPPADPPHRAAAALEAIAGLS